MTPLQRYEHDLECNDFSRDTAQAAAIMQLQRVFDDLVQREERRDSRNTLLRRLGFGSDAAVQGLYMWGGVGRGKTYLMDVFFESLPFENKVRTHFHRFMRGVHKQLKALSGTKNPLITVAENIATETQVICFDEFFVSDISDAMILAGLFQELFLRGVVLVATSNIEPDNLYKDGLQRIRFVPAIKMLKNCTQVLNVDGGTDYRLRTLEQAELYYWPLGELAAESLKDSFIRLAPDEVHWNTTIELEGRWLDVLALAGDVAWFDFYALCDGPRSQNDYIELAKECHAVLISNIPVFEASDDLARRFVNLVDEFYDRRVKLVVSAAAPINTLYKKGTLGFEFERTQSRLLEMQSKEYLALGHRPN